MIRKDKLIILSILVISVLILSIGCDKQPQSTSDDKKTGDGENNISLDNKGVTDEFVIGFYEGVLNQAGSEVLTSLALKEENIYEFYVSTIGLIDRGKYGIENNNIKFISDLTSNTEDGIYSEGKITTNFTVNQTSGEYSFEQVGSPDDFYKCFLGDYITADLNNEVIVLSLRENKLFEVSSTQVKGSFEILGGKIILSSENKEKLGTGEFDFNEETIKISLNIKDSSEQEYVFSRNSEENNITYYGASSKGMSGNTPVTLIIKPAKRFELVTSKPRGVGTYETNKNTEGQYEIIFTYTDPAKRPDGSAFTMTGTTDNEDLTIPNTAIIIEQVEYMVDMGQGDLSTMELGRVEFSSVSQDAQPAENAKTEPEVEPEIEIEPEPEGSQEPQDSSTKEDTIKDESVTAVGQYTTTVMGTTEVIMDMKSDGSYELSTGEAGTYTVSEDGTITFTPSTEGREAYSTTYNSETNTFIINFAIINGTPVSEYIFTKK